MMVAQKTAVRHREQQAADQIRDDCCARKIEIIQMIFVLFNHFANNISTSLIKSQLSFTVLIISEKLQNESNSQKKNA